MRYNGVLKLCLYINGIVAVYAFFLFTAGSARAINDPFAQQWAYESVGAYDAWQKTHGSRDVIVAVIDNGFDTFHPDLRQNVWKNIDEVADNGIDDDKNGYIDDVWGWSFIPEDSDGDGAFSDEELKGSNNPRPKAEGLTKREITNGVIHHGTAVAGLIGAVGDNNKGISGIAPNVRLMNVRVAGETGVGTFTVLGEAIRYAVDNGADVINISLVGEVKLDISDAIMYAYEHGVAVIAAAGNNMSDLNENPRYPVCADADQEIRMILGISAISERRRLAGFSNIGASCIDLTAPGVFATSTVRYSPTNGLTKQYKGGWSGTSFAAPLVSGTVALIKAIQPTWGPDQIFNAIINTAHRTPSDDYTGYEELFGAGLLQVHSAVQYALDRVVSNSVIESIVFFSPTSGKQQEVEIGKSNTTILSEQDILAGVDTVLSFVKEGQTRYITSRFETASTRALTIYTDTWDVDTSMHIPATGPLRIAVGDVTGDKRMNVVVSPAYADDQLFRVYSLSGKLLDQYSIANGSHTGVSLAITQDGQIVTYSEQNDIQTIQIFDHSFETPNTYIIASSFKEHGALAVGDVDGDLVDEIIVGGAKGDRPLVSIYEQNGDLKRTFFVYGTYQSGFSILTGEYNQDGKDDILVIPRENTQPARVWTGKSKKVAEWKVFSDIMFHDMYAFIPQL